MNVGLFLLRLILGAIFVVHGYTKLFGGPEKQVSPDMERYLGPGFVQLMKYGLAGFTASLQNMGMPMPAALAFFVAALEFFGGFLLIVGWFVRLISFLLGTEMAVAIWKVHWPKGLAGPEGYEFPLSLLGGCLALVFGGSGSCLASAGNCCKR